MLLPDIRNFSNSSIYLPILTSAAFVDTLGLFVWKYTSLPGSPIQRWYNKFGLTAYIIDVLSIMLGVVLTQIGSSFIGGPWNPAFFCFLAVVIQEIHDLFFGTIVVPLIPKGHNSVMDLMKDYVKIKNPGGILLVDAIYMICAALLTMFFYSGPLWITWFVLLWTLYVTGYILYTNP
jgi:hypothetical protein